MPIRSHVLELNELMIALRESGKASIHSFQHINPKSPPIYN